MGLNCMKSTHSIHRNIPLSYEFMSEQANERSGVREQCGASKGVRERANERSGEREQCGASK